MTLIVCLLVIALVAVVIAFLHHINRLEHAWTVERRELVNRVQAPDRLPVAVREFTIPELADDESGLVGTISYEEGA